MNASSTTEWFQKRRFGDIVADAAQRWGDREALVFGDRRWTYSELSADVDHVAKGLMALGVEPDDHVGVWLVNRPEWILLQFAIPRVGGVTVGLNTRYRVDDLAYIVDQSDCRMLIAADRSGPVDYAAMVDAVKPEIPGVETIVMLGDGVNDGAVGWNELWSRSDTVSDDALAERASSVDPDAPTLILYTSGTTSLPKGAVHSHIGIRQFLERAKIFGYTMNDVHLNYLPMFHAYGYIEISMMAALTGAKQVLMDVFDAETALDLAVVEGGTVLHGFDTHWNDLLTAQTARPRELSLRLGTLPAGMASTTATAYKTQDVFCPTVSGFGMSEVLPFVAASHPTDTVEQRCEASGYPLIDIELKVVDPETGVEQPPNVPGELLVRGYSLSSGYYKKPDETAKLIDENGWLHTGDLAQLREDGHAVFMGRQKDMLKIGGENVSPAEIEGRLADLPGVAEVAVVGVHDDRLGEVGFAFVVPDEGAELTEEELIDALQGRIASFKIPRYVRFADSLPSTASGKVRKVELREHARNELREAPRTA